MDDQQRPAEYAVVLKLLPLVMLVATVGVTVFVAFRNPLALLFGGVLLLTVLGLMVQNRSPQRGTLLTLGALTIVASAGMATFMFVSLDRNPPALVFGGMMLLSTLGLMYSGLHRTKAGSPENELKR